VRRYAASTVVFALLLVALVAGLPQRPDHYDLASAETQPMQCVDGEEMREKIREIMRESLDQALSRHIVHIFEVWMKDARDQPERARLGIHAGVNAYIAARRGAIRWTPVVCTAPGDR
jgi:hypothetical protein